MGVNFELKDVMHSSFPEESICTWAWMGDQRGDFRVFYKPVECGDFCHKLENCQHGFYFYSVRFCGGYAGNPKWCSQTLIETLYHGVALFDGLRHVYLGSEEDGIYGYVNYPNAQVHREIWRIFGILEERFCNDIDR